MTIYFDRLLAQYKNVLRIHDTAHISPVALDWLQDLSESTGLGQSSLWTSLVQAAIGTTSVGVLTYQFFTGKALRESGLDYLVSPEGPNPNNLNSAYFQSFSLENRYINFAVALGKLGEGAADFMADYGGLTLHQTVAQAYEVIFGFAPTAEKVSGLLDVSVGTMTRAEYFATFGQDGVEGIGTKAAAIGWLLAEAAKSDVISTGGRGGVGPPVLGPYAYALHQYLVDLARDGHAQFGEDLIANYDRGGPYEYQGPLDEGSPGLLISLQHDQSLSRPSGAFNGYQQAGYATDDNDLITVSGGLDAGQTIYGGEGNDHFSVTGGASRGSLNGGDGNDVFDIELFARGSLIGGLGHNTFNIGDVAPLALDPLGHVIPNQLPWLFIRDAGLSPDDPRIITRELQHDTINLGPAFGPGQVLDAVFAPQTTLDEALSWVSTQTAEDTTSVFIHGGDAWIYHQNDTPGVDAGDGLIRVFGFNGVAPMIDVHFV